MRVSFVCLGTGLILTVVAGPALSVDLDKLPRHDQISQGSRLDKVNKSLADQQIKDGQFEFKTGKAEFTPGK